MAGNFPKKPRRSPTTDLVLSLIEEVRQRDVIYNTNYERRPKEEKEEAWREIAEILNGKQNFVPELCDLTPLPSFRGRSEMPEALEEPQGPVCQGHAQTG